MISPLQIAFDIDGVFADTMGLFIDIIHEEHGLEHIQYGDITQYYLEECLDMDPDIISEVIDGILAGDYDASLEPIDDSCPVLTSVGKETPLLFVTARPSPNIHQWVCRMLPDVTFPIEVIATGSHEAKGAVLRDRGVEYFVEDYLGTCRLLDQQGITPLLFIQPWNRSPHPFREVGNWREIEDVIDLKRS